MAWCWTPCGARPIVTAAERAGGMAALEGKVAVVTGGNGGIGSAIVTRFVAEGAQVVVASSREHDPFAGDGRSRD